MYVIIHIMYIYKTINYVIIMMKSICIIYNKYYLSSKHTVFM